MAVINGQEHTHRVRHVAHTHPSQEHGKSEIVPVAATALLPIGRLNLTPVLPLPHPSMSMAALTLLLTIDFHLLGEGTLKPNLVLPAKLAQRCSDLRQHLVQDDTSWCMGDTHEDVCHLQSRQEETLVLRMEFTGLPSDKFLYSKGDG